MTLHTDNIIKKGTEFQLDSAKNGHFKGQLSKKSLGTIAKLSITCATSSTDNSGRNCCDAPWKYLNITLVGQNKVIATMFPEGKLRRLVNELYDIIGTSKFDRQ